WAEKNGRQKREAVPNARGPQHAQRTSTLATKKESSIEYRRCARNGHSYVRCNGQRPLRMNVGRAARPNDRRKQQQDASSFSRPCYDRECSRDRDCPKKDLRHAHTA